MSQKGIKKGDFQRRHPYGGSPVGTKFQCAHWYKRTNTRCGRWRSKGSVYCKKHHRWHIRPNSAASVQFGITKLPRFYGKVLTASLRQFVEQCCEAEPHEQLALWEELALMRHANLQAVALYSLVEMMPEDTPEKREKKLRSMAEAAMIMKQGLKDVADLSTKQAAIMASSKDKITVHNIEFAVRQVVRLAYAAFGDTPQVRNFEELVRTEIRIAAGPEGTTVTPDQEAAMMDGTVPAAPTSLSPTTAGSET